MGLCGSKDKTVLYEGLFALSQVEDEIHQRELRLDLGSVDFEKYANAINRL